MLTGKTGTNFLKGKSQLTSVLEQLKATWSLTPADLHNLVADTLNHGLSSIQTWCFCFRVFSTEGRLACISMIWNEANLSQDACFLLAMGNNRNLLLRGGKHFHDSLVAGSLNQNVQVQYVYHCRLCLTFDQTTMAQEQKYLRNLASLSC